MFVEVVTETGSTNADLLARLPQLRGPILLAAERQTAGRGRAGRSWYAEPGAVLTFSLAWPFSCARHRLTGLPLVVGVVLAETLSTLGAPVRLKWPNDVLKEGRKLAGILIESAKGAAPDLSWAVIGVGLNLKQPVDTSRIGQAVAGLDLPMQDVDHLLAELAHQLAAALTQFEQQGISAFIERWNTWHAHAGQRVRILEGEQIKHEGVAMGLADNGALLLKTAGGMVSVISGDVSLRAVANKEEGGHVVID